MLTYTVHSVPRLSPLPQRQLSAPNFDTIPSASCQASVDSSFPFAESSLSFLYILILKTWKCPPAHPELTHSPPAVNTAPQAAMQGCHQWDRYSTQALPCYPKAPTCPSLSLTGTGSIQSSQMQSHCNSFEVNGCAQSACSPTITWHENTHFKEIFHILRMFSEH